MAELSKISQESKLVSEASSVKKITYGVVIAFLAVLGVIIGNTMIHKSVELRTAKAAYSLEVAKSPAEQQKGLGGRTSLAPNKGMIFTFAGESSRCFWMKDMQFNIDIIWVDSHKRITHLEHNLSPATYSQEYCAEGQYVIELNAGEATRNGLKTGTSLELSGL